MDEQASLHMPIEMGAINAVVMEPGAGKAQMNMLEEQTMDTQSVAFGNHVFIG
jgi:hypothetical protein